MAVIVTGGGGAGCGRAIALCFARNGAAIVVADIDDAGGRQTVEAIEHAGGRALFHHADVRDDSQVRDLIASAERSYGRVDVLVNNASAVFRPDEPLERWAEIV